jgi:mannose-1-phosphate guanylyltransferase
VQALILAGGEGTRLRPLTSTIPKPVVPLAGRPFIAYMLEWLRGHGVEEVILACGFMADDVRAVLGDGAHLGLSLKYIEEPRPLGTGGALKFAEDLLEERFLMLNGDVLTDIDLSTQLRQHRETGARATLALVEVPDPSAYGLVLLADDGSVTAFLEKPGPETLAPQGTTTSASGRNLINAGVYVLERDVLDVLAPAGTPSSIEHDVFPRLVAQGLFGHAATGYWLDIGTPERYLQGTFDLLDGTAAGPCGGGAENEHAVAPALIEPGAMIGDGASVGPYAVLGPEATVAENVRIERAVVLEGASVGAGSLITDAIVCPRAQIGEGCRLEQDVVVGEGAVLESGSVLAPGARIFPGVVVNEGAVRP